MASNIIFTIINNEKSIFLMEYVDTRFEVIPLTGGYAYIIYLNIILKKNLFIVIIHNFLIAFLKFNMLFLILIDCFFKFLKKVFRNTFKIPRFSFLKLL